MLHKSLVHANRFKLFRENSDSEGVATKHNRDNNSHTTDTLANTTDSPNNSQNDSAVSEDTARRAPHHSDRRDPQLTIERVLCSKRYRGKL